eukprot:1152042-Prorocentrum_minimum.AAC.1
MLTPGSWLRPSGEAAGGALLWEVGPTRPPGRGSRQMDGHPRGGAAPPPGRWPAGAAHATARGAPAHGGVRLDTGS